MSDAASQRCDLLPALYEGVREDPPWSTFLGLMLQLTQAQRAIISVRSTEAGSLPLLECVAAQPGTPNPDLLAIDGYSESVLLAYGKLATNRVYSLEELLVLDNETNRRRQNLALEQGRIQFARIMRLEMGSGYLGWISLLSDRADMRRQDSDTLSFIAPHVPAAIDMFLEMETLRMRARIAEDALGRLGVGQVVLNGDGRVMLADPAASEALKLDARHRPQLQTRKPIRSICQSLSARPASAREVVSIEEAPPGHMLLRPAGPDGGRTLETAVAIGLVRTDKHAPRLHADKVLSETLGLSAREAALAAAISEGRNVSDAGVALGLRPQTARTYSKRIYAKTGTKGQAELCRLLNDGLLPFA